MASVDKRRYHPVVVINDLDSTIRDVAFDCFVFNRYGNYDKITPYNCLHANVTNIHNVFIIIIIIVGGSLSIFTISKESLKN
jgi:hypothetical protein